MHDPFIQLTNVYIERGRFYSKPLILKPEDIKEILDGKIFIANGHYDVKEMAVEIKTMVITKLAENSEAETMGR